MRTKFRPRRSRPKCPIHKKSIFEDRIAADFAMALMRDDRAKMPRRSYFDPDCGHWHVTSRASWPFKTEGISR